MRPQQAMSALVTKVAKAQGVTVDFVGGGKKRVEILDANGVLKEVSYEGKPTLAVLSQVLEAIGIPETERQEIQKAYAKIAPEVQ